MPRGKGILRVGRRYRIRWVDAYGKRRSQTYASESAARAGLRARQVEADKTRAGLVRPRAERQLAEAAAEWLKRRSARQQRDDESRLRVHILPFLGELRVGEIDSAAIERFVRHLEQKSAARLGQKTSEPLRPWTIKNTLVTLCKMLGDLGFPQRATYTVPTNGYAWIRDAADVGRFLESCRPEWFRVAAALAVYAGLRKGEVAGLRRDALDFDRGVMRIDRSYNGPTKSKQVRWVPMSPELARVLRSWLLRCPGPFVVSDHDGVPITERTQLHDRAQRACRRVGIEPVNFHQLRHTAASHLAQRMALPAVGAFLGHADPKTTARYAHLDTESLARDSRMHLSFVPPDGVIVAFPMPDGPAMDQGGEDARAIAQTASKLDNLP